MSLNYFPIGSDVAVTWEGLQDHASEAYINDATVTAVLTNSAGTTVQAFTMSYVASSDGNYRGTILNTNSLTERDPYTLTVTATAGSLKRVKRVTFPARYDSVVSE